MADNLPGEGVFGWLGRQVGYVKKAVKTKPRALPAQKAPPRPTSDPSASPEPPTVVYREGRVEEAEHPTQPGLKLRRTVIDEVIVAKPPHDPPDTSPSQDQP